MTSVIERLDPDIKIPYDEDALLSKDPERIARYMLELAETIQLLIGRITTVVNFGVDLNDGEALYLGLKDSTGRYPIGSFRWIKIESTVQLQEKITETGDNDVDWIKVASHSR